jgi:hypothetical protein
MNDKKRAEVMTNKWGSAARRARHLLIVLLAMMAGAGFAARAEAYVYWSASSNNMIERANLDGTGIAQLVQGASQPEGVTVSGSYIYWANNGTGDIGRAKLDGTDVEQQFITGGDQVRDVAVEGD